MAATVIGIYNMKGGISKTTSTINIAAELALTKNKQTKEKNRVLIIDSDSQCTATKFFFGYTGKGSSYGPKTCIYDQYGEIRKDVATLYDVLSDNENPYNAIIPCEFFTNRKFYKRKGNFFQKIEIRIDVIPCSKIMYDIPVYRKKNSNIFCEKIDLLRRSYDYIIIDCGPSYDYYTQMILNGIDYLIAPLSIDQSSSLEGFLEVRKKCSTEDPEEGRKKVEILGAFYTETELYKKNASEKYEKYKKNGTLRALDFFETYIRCDKAGVALCEDKTAPACICAPKSKIGQDYEALTKEIVNRIGELNR